MLCTHKVIVCFSYPPLDFFCEKFVKLPSSNGAVFPVLRTCVLISVLATL